MQSFFMLFCLPPPPFPLSSFPSLQYPVMIDESFIQNAHKMQDIKGDGENKPRMNWPLPRNKILSLLLSFFDFPCELIISEYTADIICKTQLKII